MGSICISRIYLTKFGFHAAFTNEAASSDQINSITERSTYVYLHFAMGHCLQRLQSSFNSKELNMKDDSGGTPPRVLNAIQTILYF